MVDDVDFRILQAMGFRAYLPDVPPADALKPARLAKRVGLGLKAVKERIARMEAEGVIAGYDAFPNLGHFPLAWKSFHFRVAEDKKGSLLKSVESIDGVIGSFSFLGKDLCIELCFRDAAEMQRRVRLISDLAGAQPWEFYDNHVPPVSRALTPLDWRIVRALRHDAKRPLADLARELKVTPRTVKNRFDRMIEEGSLWIIPRVDHAKIPGFIPFGLLVFARMDAGAKAIAGVKRTFASTSLYSWTPPSSELGHLGMFMRARTTSEIEETRRRIAGISGVERVEVLVPTAVHLSLAWIDEAIARRAAGETTAATRAPSISKRSTKTADRFLTRQ